MLLIIYRLPPLLLTSFRLEAFGVVTCEVGRLMTHLGVVKYDVWRVRKDFAVVEKEFTRHWKVLEC